MSGPSDPAATANCPICRKPSGSGALTPFCSRRCADIDLGRWLKGGYAIPGAAPDEASDTPPEAPEDPEME